MYEDSIDRVVLPVPQVRDAITETLREGARKLLGEMIRQVVEDWLAQHARLRDEQGRRQVVRNGYLPEREFIPGLGPIAVRQPRVRERRPNEEAEPFQFKILPPYLRKTKSVEELIPSSPPCDYEPSVARAADHAQLA